jgi:hypothetical protein
VQIEIMQIMEIMSNLRLFFVMVPFGFNGDYKAMFRVGYPCPISK